MYSISQIHDSYTKLNYLLIKWVIFILYIYICAYNIHMHIYISKRYYQAAAQVSYILYTFLLYSIFNELYIELLEITLQPWPSWIMISCLINAFSSCLLTISLHCINRALFDSACPTVPHCWQRSSFNPLDLGNNRGESLKALALILSLSVHITRSFSLCQINLS